MQYVLFVGIFGMPVVVALGVLVGRIVDKFGPEKTPDSGRAGDTRLREAESRMNDLVETFCAAPAEQKRRT